MEQSIFGKVNSSSVGQEILRLLWNPKVHKNLPLQPIKWALYSEQAWRVLKFRMETKRKREIFEEAVSDSRLGVSLQPEG
jgi:hypothetical protein